VTLISNELREEIAADLRKTRAPSRTAKNLGYSIRLVLAVAEQENQPRTQRKEHNGGLGNPDVFKYTVARKRVVDNWDNNTPEIAEARRSYEAGTHTLATGYDGEFAILYAIPLKRADPKPRYFTLGEQF
jgi:hypothetical protein